MNSGLWEDKQALIYTRDGEVDMQQGNKKAWLAV